MASEDWNNRNQKYTVACVGIIKSLLQKQINPPKNVRTRKKDIKDNEWPQWKTDPPPALSRICMLFNLSAFERYLLLLSAAIELDSDVAMLCEQAHGTLNSSYPTFGLALSLLPDPHWSALSPASPLRRFRLIEVSSPVPHRLTSSPLRIEERVLHYLAGISYLEPKLRGFVKAVREPGHVVDSHRSLVQRILLSLKKEGKIWPHIQLLGTDEPSKLTVARAACSHLGLNLWELPGEFVPTRVEEIQDFAQLWTREALLLESGLYISAENVEPLAQRAIRRLIEEIPGPVFLGIRDRWLIPGMSSFSLDVRKPTKGEQRQLWNTYLSSSIKRPDEHELAKVVNQFDFDAYSIQTASEEMSLVASGGVDVAVALWNACREVSRPKLSELAQHITPKANMKDLVLPEREKQLLMEIAIHARQRYKVYEEWGFEEKSSRGLGITTLFSGASGTGKTMAAEAIANELGLDIFHIDLANMISKYIGETEKNLKRVFDAAEDGGAILFFDEADALFGKRSEVRDSHDRYANIEVSYLLQRIESYRGLGILSTNMRKSLDRAFARRIRFVVEFPFPDPTSRREIWKRVFPPNTPLESLDMDHLAQLSIAGGNIQNIAMYASFLAAEEGVPVGMRHLRRAAEVEYYKMERPLTQLEVGNW